MKHDPFSAIFQSSVTSKQNLPHNGEKKTLIKNKKNEFIKFFSTQITRTRRVVVAIRKQNHMVVLPPGKLYKAASHVIVIILCHTIQTAPNLQIASEHMIWFKLKSLIVYTVVCFMHDSLMARSYKDLTLTDILICQHKSGPVVT